MAQNSEGGAGYRAVRVGGGPTVSIIVTSRGRRDRLEASLSRLLPESQAAGAEVIVVRSAGEAEMEELQSNYPDTLFVAVPATTTTGQMRVLGIDEARGDIVLLGEDNPERAAWLTARILASQRAAVTVE